MGILAMLGILCLGVSLVSPAWASGGGGAKEGEAAEGVLEITRRPAPVVDPLDVFVSEAAIKAKSEGEGEEREIERHEESVVTPLTLALSPEEGAPKGEGAEVREMEMERHLELTAPRLPAEEETRGKGKGKKKGGGGEGEGGASPAEVEVTRHPEAVVSTVEALLEKLEPPKGGEGEAAPPDVEMRRHEEPVINAVSLAFTKAEAGTKAGGEGNAGSEVEFERHPRAFFEKETKLEARLNGGGQKEEAQVQTEVEFTRHPESEIDETDIAVATAESSTKEGGAVEDEFPRKPGPVIDPVDVALASGGGKAQAEGAADLTEMERKPEPVVSESEIPGSESTSAEARPLPPKRELEPLPPKHESEPSPPTIEPGPARAASGPQHGQLLTIYGVIGSKSAAAPIPRAGQKTALALRWPGRDLSTPARRLIGHWTFRMGRVQGDYWFAPIDPRSGIGSLIVNDQGTIRRGSWRLVKEDLQAQSVTVGSRLLTADPFTFPIPENGATLVELYSSQSALTLEYADQGTAPGLAGGRRATTSPQGAQPQRIRRLAGRMRRTTSRQY